MWTQSTRDGQYGGVGEGVPSQQQSQDSQDGAEWNTAGRDCSAIATRSLGLHTTRDARSPGQHFHCPRGSDSGDCRTEVDRTPGLGCRRLPAQRTRWENARRCSSSGREQETRNSEVTIQRNRQQRPRRSHIRRPPVPAYPAYAASNSTATNSARKIPISKYYNLSSVSGKRSTPMIIPMWMRMMRMRGVWMSWMN